MQELLDLLKKYQIEINPEFTGKFERNGAQYFQGRKFKNGLIWCCFGDWSRTDAKYTWQSGEPLPEDMPEIKKILEEEAGAREAKYEEVAKLAGERWQKAAADWDCTSIPYFTKKNLGGLYGCRVELNEHGYPVLLVPMYDSKAKIWNLTRIYDKQFENGNKFLLPGGRKKGLFHGIIGSEDSTQPLFICEGIATAASIWEALEGKAKVICAFDAGNLPEVAKILKERMPLYKFIICADDDVHKPESGNAGRAAGEKARNACQGKLIFPKFKDLTLGGTDFNDLHCQEGLDAVRAQLLQNNSNNIATDNSETHKEKPKEETKAVTTAPEHRLVMDTLSHYGKNLLKWKKDLFVYQEEVGYWAHFEPEDAADKFYKLLVATGPKGWKHKDIVSAYNRLLRFIPRFPHNPFTPDRYRVAFTNGTLHLVPGTQGTWSMELKPHDRENYLIHAHPFAYDLTAPYSPEFDEAVEKVLGPGEAIRNAYYEVLGACLVPGAFRKLVFFVGPPKSGKSTLIQFPWHMVDERYRCSVDPTQMTGFHTETLAGKLLNADADICLSKPLTDSILKKIEDGTEITIQRKGIANVMASVPGMHLFGGNGMPMTTDGTDPYQRRMLIFKCDRYQAPEGYNQRFVADVMAAGRGGIVRRALEGLTRLCSQGGHFSQSDEAKETMREWRDDNQDEISMFIEELRNGAMVVADSEVKKSLQEESSIPRKMMMKLYNSWMEEISPKSRRSAPNYLYKKLREAGFKEKKIDGVRYFTGISVSEARGSQK